MIRIFQDGYEYSENIANIEFADESNSFIKLESEPDQDLSSSTIFSDDNEAEWASIELDSDTINKILINDMKCETVSILTKCDFFVLFINLIDTAHSNFYRKIINFP